MIKVAGKKTLKSINVRTDRVHISLQVQIEMQAYPKWQVINLSKYNALTPLPPHRFEKKKIAAHIPLQVR